MSVAQTLDQEEVEGRFTITVRSVANGAHHREVIQCRDYYDLVARLFRVARLPRAHGENREVVITDHDDPSTIRLHVRTTPTDMHQP